MRKKNFKGRVQKRVLSKSKEVVRTYDAIQYALTFFDSHCLLTSKTLGVIIS